MTTRSTFLLGALILGALGVAPRSADAQRLRLADSTALEVMSPAPQLLSAFPEWWRDSVTAGWARHFTGATYRPAEPLPATHQAVIRLQLLRNGDLRRARITKSSGDRGLDSVLIRTSWAADEGLAYPKFPAGIDGAGTEVELVVVFASATPPRLPGDRGGAAVGARQGDYELPPLSPRCDSLLALPNGSSRMTLRLRPDTEPGDPAEADWETRVLTALQPEFHAPGLLTLGARPRVWLGDAYPNTIRVSLPGVLHIVTDSVGDVKEAGMVISSGFPTLDSALVATVWAADSAGAIPPPPPGSATATLDAALVTDRGETHLGVPLGVVALGVWVTDGVPRLVRPGRTIYPDALRQQGIGGRVVLEFVVGSDGVPVAGSVTALSSPHPTLTASATETILTTRYAPAGARGCAVPVIVRQGVNYQAGR